MRRPEARTGLLLGALALTLYALSSALLRFDGLYGQDPYGYYGYALQVEQSIRSLQLPPWYYWPMGYPLLVAAGFALAGAAPLAAQSVSMAAGAGVVVLTWALCRALLRQEGLLAEARAGAVVAGLVALACGQLWQWSVTIMADAPALCWACLAAWALVRYARELRWRWLALCAAGLAFALTTRWVYGLLAGPLAAYWLVAVWRLADGGARRAALRHLLAGALLGLALLAPQLLVSAAYPQGIVAHQWLTGWSPLNALRSSFVTVDGRAEYPLPVALFYARAAASPRFMAPPLTVLLVLGLLGIVRLRLWRTGALALGWGGLMYAFLSGIPYQNMRFALALLPPAAVVAGTGYALAAGRMPGRWRLALIAWVALGVGVGLFYSAGVLGEQARRKDADLAVARWAAAQVAPGAHVLAFEITLTLRHYTALDVHELFDATPADLEMLSDDERPLYVLVDVADLREQWQGRPPERNYRWLRQGPGLDQLGRMGAYTLFRVGHSAQARRGGLAACQGAPCGSR
jgi:4-amino-4-deoxy-L-arabinose transferase-like glycosyltransferase